MGCGHRCGGAARRVHLDAPYWGSAVEADGGEVPWHAPPGTFTRFEPFDSRTPAEHIAKIEELILN